MGMAIKDLVLTPQQSAPVPILQGGIVRGKDKSTPQEGLLLVDLSQRDDLRRLIEEQRSSPEGECSSVWGRPSNKPEAIQLILHFVRPLDAVAILEFDVPNQGMLVDVLMQHSPLTLVPGSPGEQLDEPPKEERPSMRVEVAADFGSSWDDVWAEAVASRHAVSVEAASRIVRYERAERDLRVLFPDSPPMEKVVDLFLHPTEGAVVFVTDDMLINQIKRDNPKIAKAFDPQFETELNALSRDFSQTAGLIARGAIENRESTAKKLIGALLSNAINGVAAAVELTRLGYRLQPAAPLRVSAETTAVAIQLTLNDDKVNDFLAGKLKSTEAIGPAKQVVPFMGRLYGYLSEQFTHAGPLFGEMQLNTPYDATGVVVARTNLLAVQSVLLAIGLAAEIAFFDCVKVPRYWIRSGPDTFALALRPDVERTIDNLSARLLMMDEDKG